jgi:protocatechuate 3,4-dioxygenase beta subunit
MSLTIARRRLLLAGLALPAAAGIGGELRAAELPETPACPPAGAETPRQTEGPYYTARPPLKRDFRADGRSGKPIVLMGFVLTRSCAPVADAVVDLWHADGDGAYDNRGFALRGFQKTDARGRYLFETLVPGRYPGRTAHYHVKVQRPGGPVLTTQLYFPDEPQNRRDFLFDAKLLMQVRQDAGLTVGRFDFVVG